MFLFLLKFGKSDGRDWGCDFWSVDHRDFLLLEMNVSSTEEGRGVDPGRIKSGSERVEHHRDRENTASDQYDVRRCLAEYPQGRLCEPSHGKTSCFDLSGS